MSILTITRAINSGIERSVVVSELKHTEKLAALRESLAIDRDLRIKANAQRHTDATIAHATWHQSLSKGQQEQYAQSLALVISANAPKE